MLEKAKELQRQRIENKKTSSKNSGGDFSGGFGSSSSMSSQSSQRYQSPIESIKPDSIQPPSFSSSNSKPSRGMKLGGEKQLPAFLEQTIKQTLPSSNSNVTQSPSLPSASTEK